MSFLSRLLFHVILIVLVIGQTVSAVPTRIDSTQMMEVHGQSPMAGMDHSAMVEPGPSVETGKVSLMLCKMHCSALSAMLLPAARYLRAEVVPYLHNQELLNFLPTQTVPPSGRPPKTSVLI